MCIWPLFHNRYMKKKLTLFLGERAHQLSRHFTYEIITPQRLTAREKHWIHLHKVCVCSWFFSSLVLILFMGHCTTLQQCPKANRTNIVNESPNPLRYHAGKGVCGTGWKNCRFSNSVWYHNQCHLVIVVSQNSVFCSTAIFLPNGMSVHLLFWNWWVSKELGWWAYGDHGARTWAQYYVPTV